jgi:hypothetical protein
MAFVALAGPAKSAVAEEMNRITEQHEIRSSVFTMSTS